MIEWFSKKEEKFEVIFSKNAITFSKDLATFLDNPNKILVGCDKEKKLFVAKSCYENNKDGINFTVTNKKGDIRVEDKEVINYVANYFGIELSRKGLKFSAKFDKKDKIITVDVSGFINKVDEVKEEVEEVSENQDSGHHENQEQVENVGV